MSVRAGGPVAISAANLNEAVVLQLGGRVSTFDLKTWTPGSMLYEVPRDFDAVDMSAAIISSGRVICLVVNGHVSGQSFVLQLLSGHEVWTWLNVKGVYTGVAIDPAHGFAYAANSTTNAIFRIRLGEEKQTPEKTATFYQGQRIGPIALDVTGQRLFAADSDGRQIFVRDLEHARTRAIQTSDLGEMRALTWDPSRSVLYVVDSGNEGIWRVALDSLNPQLLMRDSRFREPSGLTMGPQDLLIATDERSGFVFSLSPADRSIRQVARVSPEVPTK